jgi:hypothetical protein
LKQDREGTGLGGACLYFQRLGAGGVAQVVACLSRKSSKCEALSSNPSTEKKVLPALGRLRQEDFKFKVKLGKVKTGKLCLQKQKEKNK